jgi:hypothetical protein
VIVPHRGRHLRAKANVTLFADRAVLPLVLSFLAGYAVITAKNTVTNQRVELALWLV